MWVEGWIIVGYRSVVVVPSHVRSGRATYSIGPTLSQRSWVARRRQNIGPIGACWLGKFAANRKRVCDFLLVRNSNFSPILHRFGDLIGFMCPYSTLILGVFPLHQIPHVGRQPAHGP